MDLINATGETIGWRYGGVYYAFPPNELVKVKDDCGRHMLNHLARRGLQEVRFGDDPEKISLVAVRAAVKFYREQVATHDLQVKKAEEQKNPIPEVPQGYKDAKAALGAYENLLGEVEERAEAAAAKKKADSIASAVRSTPESVTLEDMDTDELRDMVRSLGGNPGNTTSPSKLIGKIEKLRASQGDGGE